MKMNAEHFFRELKRDITTYGELKFELLKVGTYERTGKVIAVLAYGLILLILGFFLSLFVFLTLGFFLGEWLDSKGTGFSIVVGIYLLMIGGVVLLKDKIQTFVLNNVIAALISNDHKTDETDEQNISEADPTE